MLLRNGKIVRNDRQRSHHVIYEALPLCSMTLGSQFHPYQQLGHGDGGYGDVVLVVEDRVQIRQIPLRVDEKRRVKENQTHDRTSISISSRSSRRSVDHPLSAACRRSISLMSAPRPVLIGSRDATALPLRMMVYRALSCSMLSSTSEKRLAASVAEMSGIEIRLSDLKPDVKQLSTHCARWLPGLHPHSPTRPMSGVAGVGRPPLR